MARASYELSKNKKKILNLVRRLNALRVPVKFSMIRDELGITNNGVTWNLDTLERLGFITRKRNDTGTILITKAGRKIADEQGGIPLIELPAWAWHQDELIE